MYEREREAKKGEGGTNVPAEREREREAKKGEGGTNVPAVKCMDSLVI